MNPGILQLRARSLQALRSFLIKHDYLEVDTPTLAPSLIPESHLEVFRTDFVHPDHEPRELYLTPSPEMWIKRLLAEGAGSLFQLGKSYRNGESIGDLHEPEFTMLEYYTLGSGYMESIELTEELFKELLEAVGEEARAHRARGGVSPELDALEPPFERISVGEAFEQYAGVQARYLADPEALRTAARRRGMRSRDEETYEELFNRVFVHLVEPRLPRDGAVVLYDYPAAIPTLAARKEGTPWAERWELYLGGIETANCYTEERDQRSVRRFFAAEGARKSRAMVPHRIDGAYYRIFGENFPFCSGVAMGVDRLLMVLLGERSIKRVIPFTVFG
ncbi:MAG: EF-P lysine aminoacylase GenX [Spirochaetaceae bacterium]